MLFKIDGKSLDKNELLRILEDSDSKAKWKVTNAVLLNSSEIDLCVEALNDIRQWFSNEDEEKVKDIDELIEKLRHKMHISGD